MPILDPVKGSVVSPDCAWGDCALFEVPPSGTVRLERNGQQESWVLVSGHAEVLCQGTSRKLHAPAVLPVRSGGDSILRAADALVLLRCLPNGRGGN